MASVSSLNGLSVCNVVYATGLHGFCVLVFFGFYGWLGTVVSLVSVVCVIGLFFFPSLLWCLLALVLFG